MTPSSIAANREAAVRGSQEVGKAHWSRWLWWWSTVCYLTATGTLVAYAVLGVTSWRVPLCFLASVVAGHGFIYLALNTGLDVRLRDPGLRRYIIIDGYVRQLGLYLLAPEVGWLALLYLLSMFSYASMATTQRRMLQRLTVASVVILAAFPLVADRFVIPTATLAEKIVAVVAILLEIGRTSYLSGFLNHLRSRLRLRSQEATAANQELAAVIEVLKATRGQLVETEKLAALGRLVSGVAHELDAPLAACTRACTRLLEQAQGAQVSFEGGALRRSGLEEFLQEARHSLDLIQRNLGLANERVHRFKEIESSAVLHQRSRFALKALAEQMVERHAEWRGSAQIAIDVGEGIELDSFPGAVERVLEALVANALLHGLAGDAGHIRIAATAAAGDRVALIVSDDGRGIPAQHLPHLFEPYYTASRDTALSGLGLTTVRSLVVGSLGGSIDIASPAGTGVIVSIVLPRVAPSPGGEHG